MGLLPPFWGSHPEVLRDFADLTLHSELDPSGAWEWEEISDAGHQTQFDRMQGKHLTCYGGFLFCSHMEFKIIYMFLFKMTNFGSHHTGIINYVLLENVM